MRRAFCICTGRSATRSANRAMSRSRERCFTTCFRWQSARHVPGWSSTFPIAGDARRTRRSVTGRCQAKPLFQPYRLINPVPSRATKHRASLPRHSTSLCKHVGRCSSPPSILHSALEPPANRRLATIQVQLVLSPPRLGQITNVL